VAALAAMAGVESQLQSHVRISMNVGLTGPQLSHLADVLAERGQVDAARRVRVAVAKQLADATAG
jgi:alkylhydroperoxidase/carboxymuconolactone decarboxylase family protein YurZ